MTLFNIENTSIEGLLVLKRKPFGDKRGYFERLFCVRDLKEILGASSVIQINHSQTVKKGTVRGMHYQVPPHAELKLVSCLKGEVFDVAIDLRRDSTTFLEWHAEKLSADNQSTLVIPEGFAHGFQTLTDDCEMLYMHTEFYKKSAEAGLDALDQKVAIDWPLDITHRSSRDQNFACLNSSFKGVVL